jgi:xylulokinase
VYWTSKAESILSSLDVAKPLHSQLEEAFSLPNAPIWQDSSTAAECRYIESAVGGAQALSDRTGSRAYERFTGSQIAKVSKSVCAVVPQSQRRDYLKVHRSKPEAWSNTTHISLISSFLASLFTGRIAPIEVADASGMNLMSIKDLHWDDEILKICGGKELESKLGSQPVPGGTSLGKLSRWWVEKHGFNSGLIWFNLPSMHILFTHSIPLDCIVAPFTGDNPSSIVSLSNPGDAIISLGTSTTLLVSIPPSPTPPFCTTTSHLLAHPTTPGGYIAMLCYKNGGLTRENVRDRFSSKSWDTFNEQVKSTPVGNNGYTAFYFALPEIIPDGVKGEFFFRSDEKVDSTDFPPEAHARAILESQLLSIESRVLSILPSSSHALHRCIVTGGSSANPIILQLVADIFDLPVYVASTSASATIGGALLAKYAWWKAGGGKGTFEDMRGTEKRVVEVAKPNEEHVRVYQDMIESYRKHEDKVVELCTRL